MTRALAALLVLGLAAGCTSGATSPAERLRPALEEAIFGPDEPDEPPPPITRAVLNQIPAATISIETDTVAPGYVAAVSRNGDYVVYQDITRRSMTLRGGLITGTHGFGYNLRAVKTQLDDPVVVPTPLAGWPGEVVRNYQFPLKARPDYEITVRCAVQPVARERIEIVEVFYAVTRVQEVCGNGVRTFTNLYWVEEETGFIWQSRQWIGPRQESHIIKIIRPFG